MTDPHDSRPIDSTRALAQRARKLFAESGRDPLQSLRVRRAVRAQLEAAVVPPPSAAAALETLEAVPSAAVPVAAADVMDAAASAMEKVRAGNESNVTDREFMALEAIVLLTGRPAMRYTDGRVQMPEGEDNERWMTFVATARSKIDAASAKVGQVAIDAPGSAVVHVGTAWRLGDDLVVTNRHVAAELVRDRSLPPGEWTLDPAKPGVVNFSVTDGARSVSRFAVAELAYCAPEETVDLAVFRVAAGAVPLPGALPLDWSESSVGRDLGEGTFRGEEVYVVGHPWRPFASEEVVTVFQRADGFKRCSPGQVTMISPLAHAFEHDCSTLGGNSGSCVLTVRGHKVIGLHYGGKNVNLVTAMGESNLALGFARLGEHRAARILREGRVT